MKKMFLAIVGGVLAYAVVASSVSANSKQNQVTAESTKAAYRDGLFQARMQLRDGQIPRVSAARWSRAEDRELFVAGYQAGYAEQHGAISVPSGNQQRGYREGLQEGAADRSGGRTFRMAPNYSEAGSAAVEQKKYTDGYANGYQLAYYGQQEVTDALVIRAAKLF